MVYDNIICLIQSFNVLYTMKLQNTMLILNKRKLAFQQWLTCKLKGIDHNIVNVCNENYIFSRGGHLHFSCAIALSR